MRKNELDSATQRQRLGEKKAELETTLRQRNGIVIEQEADPLDQLSSKAERELQVAQLDRVGELLKQVIAAIKRLDDGSYGMCLECDEGISVKRLLAVPWAALCIHCQEKEESVRGADRSHEVEVLQRIRDDEPADLGAAA